MKLVQTTSAGTDQLDKTALGEMGIRVSNNGGGNAVAVAEHTIALLVSTIRKLQLQFNAVKAGEWAGDIRAAWFSQANEIAGKTVGIVGLGRIGSRSRADSRVGNATSSTLTWLIPKRASRKS